jgi:hypothetical protein
LSWICSRFCPQVGQAEKIWNAVPETLQQLAITTFKSCSVANSETLTKKQISELSACKAFLELPGRRLVPASPALLLIMRHDGKFVPQTLDDFIIIGNSLLPKL